MDKRGDHIPLDLHSLRREFAAPPALPEGAPRPEIEEERSLADRAVDILIPLMIFCMMLAVAWFLLDIRFIYTERLDINMRAFAFFFVMGIVALNRLRADRAATDSGVYLVGMIFAVGMFTVVTQLRGGGLAGGVMTSMLPSLCFNISVVAILWKVTDRLTRDCCVDASARYGEVGILRGGWLRKAPPAEVAAEPEIGKGRLPRKHPANSLFYLAIPIMILLAIGQRLLPQGGSLMESAGSVYVGVYTAAMLLLLMLSSYRGLRVYCQRRAITFPTSIAAFWLGLGSLMVGLVLILGLWGPVPAKPEAWQGAARQVDESGRTISTKYDYHEYRRWSEASVERGQQGELGPEGREGQSSEVRQPGSAQPQEPNATNPPGDENRAGSNEPGSQQQPTDHRSPTQNQQRPQGGQQGQQASYGGVGGQSNAQPLDQHSEGQRSQSGSQSSSSGEGDQQGGQGSQSQSSSEGQQPSQSMENDQEQSTGQESSAPTSEPPSTQIPMNELMDAAPALKWLAYGVLALMGLFFLYFLIHAAAHYFGRAAGRRGKRAGLFDRLARFFRRLTYVPKRKPRRPRVKVDRDIATCARYQNPLNGQGTLREKIQYSYDALCALAYDLGVPREEGETPFEYLARLPEPIEEMRPEAHALTHLYVAGSYSTLQIPDEAASELGKFWKRFERLRGRVVR